MPVSPAPTFYPLMESFARVHAYLLDDGEALTLIDALRHKGGKVIFDALSGLGRRPADVRRIFLTHAHPTHVNGAAAVQVASGAPVYAPVEEADIIEGRRPSNRTTRIPRRPLRILPQQFLLNFQNASWNADFRPALLNVQPVKVDHLIQHGHERIGPVMTIRTPGHSPGGTSFYWPEIGALFCGDAIGTWPKFEPGWRGLSEDYRQNLDSLGRLLRLFEGQGLAHPAFLRWPRRAARHSRWPGRPQEVTRPSRVTLSSSLLSCRSWAGRRARRASEYGISSQSIRPPNAPLSPASV